MKTILKTAAVGAVFLAGCVATDRVERGNYRGVFDCDSSVDPGDAETESSPETPVHEGPWTWEELAVRAGRNSSAMKDGRLAALVARLKATQAVAWKDPEFRFLNRWSDEDAYDWTHKYVSSGIKDEGKTGDGDGWSRQFGVRFYVPNPFINHYLAAKGDASVRACEAKAETEAYAIYTEVKMLCAEYLKASREARLYAKRVEVVARMKKTVEAERENRVAKSPLDAISVETQYRLGMMRLADLERSASGLKRTIARLAGVPAEGFEISDSCASLPDPSLLDADELAEIAFARRPDLAGAIAERDAAEAGVGAAKAAYIPWFRFVEGSYRRGVDRDGYDEFATDGNMTYSRGRNKSEDWSVELAINIPIFTWCGNSVKISRQIRDCAEERVFSLYDDVRAEIRSAIDSYRLACSRGDTGSDERFVEDVSKQIEDYAKSEAMLESESEKSRQALIDYQLLCNDVQSEKVEAALRLESVLGGPIPSRP